MAHLVPVKTHSGSMSGSQSLQEQPGTALSEAISTGSPRPEMPRQNSDPTSDAPGAPMSAAGREERDRDRERDRTTWLREEDLPPKVRKSESEETELKSRATAVTFCLSVCVCVLRSPRGPHLSPLPWLGRTPLMEAGALAQVLSSYVLGKIMTSNLLSCTGLDYATGCCLALVIQLYRFKCQIKANIIKTRKACELFPCIIYCTMLGYKCYV